jgi:hypothetical protein
VNWKEELQEWLSRLADEEGLTADMRTIQTFDQEPALIVISTKVGVDFDTAFEEWWAHKVKEQTAQSYQDYLSTPES